ncbi:type II toxin-antitoxin system prevent-host-death family antitoxin [Streptomyces sp. NPDC001156]
MKEEPVEMSTAEVRTNLADVINAAVRNRITFVTSRGRRVAAVVPLAIAEEAVTRDDEQS